jgi:hypothetical protein
MAETGNAINVANFKQMISSVQGYGGVYKPANTAIELGALQSSVGLADAGMDGVTTSLMPWKVKVNDRENEYAGIGKLSTRVAASFASSGAEANAVEDMKGFARKIAGARKSKIPIDDPNTPEDESKHNSVSQRSYTQIVEHFDNMIGMCENEPKYHPNETELQVGSLHTKSDACKQKNQGVIDTITPLDNSRIGRDKALYDESTGIVELARLVKLYVKSLFGAGSPEYRQISGLRFTKPR